MKKILVWGMVLLLLNLVGCSKSYTEEDIERIEAQIDKFNNFIRDFEMNNSYGEPEILNVLLCEIEENDGIVDKSIIEDTTKRIENEKDDLNSYNIEEFKDCIKYVSTDELGEEETDKFLKKIDLVYETIEGVLEQYSEIVNMGSDGRYNSAEIENTNEIIKKVHEEVSNNLDIYNY